MLIAPGQVSDAKTSKVIKKMGEQSRAEGVECMCWGGGEEPEECVVVGAASGIVNVWELEVRGGMKTEADAHVACMHSFNGPPPPPFKHTHLVSSPVECKWGVAGFDWGEIQGWRGECVMGAPCWTLTTVMWRPDLVNLFVVNRRR